MSDVSVCYHFNILQLFQFDHNPWIGKMVNKPFFTHPFNHYLSYLQVTKMFQENCYLTELFHGNHRLKYFGVDNLWTYWPVLPFLCVSSNAHETVIIYFDAQQFKRKYYQNLKKYNNCLFNKQKIISNIIAN